MSGVFIVGVAGVAILLAGTPLFPVVVAVLCAAILYHLLTGNLSLPTV